MELSAANCLALPEPRGWFAALDVRPERKRKFRRIAEGAFATDRIQLLFILKMRKTSGTSPEAFLGLDHWCRWRDSNPHDPFGSTDFKSDIYAGYTIW